ADGGGDEPVMSGPKPASSDPLVAARAVLSRVPRLGVGGGVGLEVYAQFARTATVKVFGGRAESVATAEPRGLGVRAMDGYRVGYSYTADLSDVGMDKVVLESIENARAAAPDEFQALPAGPLSYPALADLWRPGVSGTTVDQKVAIAMEAEATALAKPEVAIVEISEYSDTDSKVAIVSNQGVEIQGEQSFCFAYVFALAGGEGDRQSGLGFTAGREPAELDARAAGAEAADKARRLLGAKPCATGSYTVVFDREVAAALLGLIGSALSADAWQKGRSVFRGKLGEQVASSMVTLWDDGLAAGGLATNPFDAEGVPQRSTLLVEDGVLRKALHDTHTARKEGGETVSTGNASRGSYRSLPSVGLSNLVLRPGEGELEDLLRRVGTGLYVDSAAGLHSGVNPVTGEISVGVTGRLIEDGVAGRPVREVTIATDFISLLQSIGDLAGDSRWIPLYGSVRTPSIAVQAVAVSGK
ncbi:MAG TPA: TldD/PmbA family protein, partial [Thermoleophilia bacterium]|nr:TldD/PmbA family protein [Thermoleophilia bacterium]